MTQMKQGITMRAGYLIAAYIKLTNDKPMEQFELKGQQHEKPSSIPDSVSAIHLYV